MAAKAVGRMAFAAKSDHDDDRILACVCECGVDLGVDTSAAAVKRVKGSTPHRI